MMNKKEKSWGLYKRSEFIREGETSPYLIRYNLFECPWFSIKIHKIMQTDNDCMHDHPWSFLSIILKGGYWEIIPVRQLPKHSNERRYKWRCYDNPQSPSDLQRRYGVGSILYRPANWIHRLELNVVESRLGERYEYSPATTLVITFKKSREWGFWTKKGWVPWNKYKGVNKCE